MAAVHSRPATVTIVVVLTWVAALVDIVAGAALVLASLSAGATRATGEDSATLMLIGVIALLLGLIVAGVASRLGRGGNGARLLVSILMVLHIAGAIATATTVGPTALGEALISIVLSAAVLLLLWNRAANAFFAR